MNTLHKIAGIEAESDDREDTPSQPVPAPPPIPKDEEDEKRLSRASLPLSRKASRKSIKSIKSSRSQRFAERNFSNEKQLPPPPRTPNDAAATNPGDLEAGLADDADADEREGQSRPSADSRRHSDIYESEDGDGFEWGPDHPCYPHPNPHAAPDSKIARTTRVIRVRRDYMAAGDRYPQYANLYPEILEPLVSDSDFRLLVTTLNSLCRDTFDAFTWRAWVDGFLGAFTGWFWEDLGLTGVKTGAKKIEQFVDNWNSGKRKEGKEVSLVQLRDVAFMSLDLIIPDPGLDLPDDG